MMCTWSLLQNSCMDAKWQQQAQCHGLPHAVILTKVARQPGEYY